MAYQDDQKQIEFLRQEADRYGKLAEHYRAEIERVKCTAVALIATIMIALIALMFLLPKPQPGSSVPAGEIPPIIYNH